MAKPRKQGNRSTTISIPWNLKNRIRSFASPTKKTDVGQNYESDAQVIQKVIELWALSHEGRDITKTYPTKERK